MSNALRQLKADIFQALSHPTRIAILEMLREGEQTAGTLVARLGLEQANASQHLTVLRMRQIVLKRKDGNHVLYRVRDPVLFDVLEIMHIYFQAHLAEAMTMLQAMDSEEVKPR